jgi:metal-responsive CopG/Arc/MetJ family transcriptional regulator
MVAPDKKRTSIYIQEKLWSEWMHFVIDQYGSSRKASEALEDAMREFMQNKTKIK